MFGRHRARTKEGRLAEELPEEDLADDDFSDEFDDEDLDDTEEEFDDGPWDADDDYPEVERLDLGGLQIPIADDVEVHLNIYDDQVVAATVTHEESAMQVNAFAAPKSGALWSDVRREIVTDLQRYGGSAEEVDGPFGVELRTMSPTEDDDGKPGPLEPARIVGVDGPRWFLRAFVNGPAARDEEAARRLEDIFADIVVVRGDAPQPPREALELRLPRQAQQELEAHLAEEGEGFRRGDFNPFERGPEITEVR